MTKAEKTGSTAIIVMTICVFFGLWAGITIGEWSSEKRIVIDNNDHLIYDGVLYKRVIPSK